MAEAKALIQQAYTAFNARNIDAALALMTEDVHWPKASEGGSVVGKEEIRAYWTRQWSEFDPHVQPVEITQTSGESVRVRVHQVVKNLGGDLLAEGEVVHLYTLRNGLIAAMQVEGVGEAPSEAFAHR